MDTEEVLFRRRRRRREGAPGSEPLLPQRCRRTPQDGLPPREQGPDPHLSGGSSPHLRGARRVLQSRRSPSPPGVCGVMRAWMPKVLSENLRPARTRLPWRKGLPKSGFFKYCIQCLSKIDLLKNKSAYPAGWNVETPSPAVERPDDADASSGGVSGKRFSALLPAGARVRDRSASRARSPRAGRAGSPPRCGPSSQLTRLLRRRCRARGPLRMGGRSGRSGQGQRAGETPARRAGGRGPGAVSGGPPLQARLLDPHPGTRKSRDLRGLPPGVQPPGTFTPSPKRTSLNLSGRHAPLTLRTLVTTV